MTNIRRTTYSIPEDLHRQLKAHLALQGIKISTWFREQVKKELNIPLDKKP